MSSFNKKKAAAPATDARAVAAATSPSAVNYMFNNEEDFAFYVLNAIAHDFIHDFNNYKRMRVILNYIMGLVQPALGIPGGQASGPSGIVSAQGTFDTAYRTVTREEGIQQTQTEVTLREESRLVPATITPELPKPDPISDPGERDDEVDLNKSALVPESSVSTDEVVDLKPNKPDESTDVEFSTAQAIDEHFDVTTEEMFNSQLNQCLDINTKIEPPTGSTSLETIVKNSIISYNELNNVANTGERITRRTTYKVRLFQRLRDFIQENIFLIVSKIVNRSTSQSEQITITTQTGGDSGINIIKKSDILNSIDNIINEINEITSEDMISLINIFKYIKSTYLYLNIPNISPLEILSNSLIEDSLCIYVIGQCNNDNIDEQAQLCLSALISSNTNSDFEKIKNPIYNANMLNIFNRPNARGIPLNPTIRQQGGFNLRDITNQSVFEGNIDNFKEGAIYSYYKGTPGTLTSANINSPSTGIINYVYREYSNFKTANQAAIDIIVNENIRKVKISFIEKYYNYAISVDSGKRNAIQTISGYFKQMLDTINDFIIIKVIGKYEDVKNRSAATSKAAPASADSATSSSITGESRRAVQKISQLVAKKILQLTGLMRYVLPSSPSPSQIDLNKQIEILKNVAENDGKGYTTVDDNLINYFTTQYASNSFIKCGTGATNQLTRELKNCSKEKCRVINNAIPAEFKQMITNTVVCPTSSVCDGMSSFGSCTNPTNNKEFANMDFIISYPGEHGNSYSGQTNIKPDFTSVNINYNFIYKNLNLYNSINIRIDKQPEVLEANFVFKNLINQIIQIWKTQRTQTDINALWTSLEGTDYFTSIIQVGSQKAVGDLYQELNSTLQRGAYNVVLPKVVDKNTYGLMGDRPSGVRVVKLLKDAMSGKNPRASGGYVGGETSLIYFISSPRGGRMTRKKKKKYNTRTKKNRKYSSRFTKKKKYNK